MVDLKQNKPLTTVAQQDLASLGRASLVPLLNMSYFATVLRLNTLRRWWSQTGPIWLTEEVAESDDVPLKRQVWQIQSQSTT